MYCCGKNKFKYIVIVIFLGISLNAQLYEGYTIFTPYNNESTTTFLIGNDQNIVHIWTHEYGPASMPYLMPDSSIIYPFRVPEPTMQAGGQGGGIQRISWDGSVVWEYTVANDTYQQHHDIQPLPNGNILIIAWERKTDDEAYAMGRVDIENALNEMWSEAILELDPSSGEMVWEWHLWDHLIQDVNQDLPNYGIVSEHPELMNINFGDVGMQVGQNADWMHYNSVDYDEGLDQIVFSSRAASEVYVIDHSTTSEQAAGHSGGDSGMGGDFLYRWGNPQVYGRGDSLDRKLYDPHCANWTPPSNEVNIIVFNNGVGRPEGEFSSVDVIIPPINPDGTYEINQEESYGPAELSWFFSDGESFFSVRQSSAYRLENGNTLIAVSNSKRILEVTLQGDIVWDFVWEDDSNTIPRAMKYGLDYLNSDNQETIELSNLNGWNLIGLPLGVNEPNYLSLFPNAVEGTLFSFNNNNYIQSEFLETGNGYWLRFPQDEVSVITGTPFTEITITLSEGWNLISGTSSISDIVDTLGIIISGTLYGYNEAYYNTTFLQPGKSCWVRANSDGSITLISR